MTAAASLPAPMPAQPFGAQVAIDDNVRPKAPIDFNGMLRRLETASPREEVTLLYDAEFHVTLMRGVTASAAQQWSQPIGEAFIYVLRGTLDVRVRPSGSKFEDAAANSLQTFPMKEQDVFLIPSGYAHQFAVLPAAQRAFVRVTVRAVVSDTARCVVVGGRRPCTGGVAKHRCALCHERGRRLGVSGLVEEFV